MSLSLYHSYTFAGRVKNRTKRKKRKRGKKYVCEWMRLWGSIFMFVPLVGDP